MVQHEIPAPVDSFFLKVIAKAEIPEHFKKSQVRGITYRLDIVSPEALLAGGRAAVSRYGFARKIGFELHHAGPVSNSVGSPCGINDELG